VEGNEAQTERCLRRMNDDLLQTGHDLRQLRLDLERIEFEEEQIKGNP